MTYDTILLFWRIVVNIFFREIRPRGAWNIPKDGAVIFVAAPHSNQVCSYLVCLGYLKDAEMRILFVLKFLDPILLASETLREARRRVAFLIAAKSMRVNYIGFFAGLMGSSKPFGYYLG